MPVCHILAGFALLMLRKSADDCASISTCQGRPLPVLDLLGLPKLLGKPSAQNIRRAVRHSVSTSHDLSLKGRCSAASVCGAPTLQPQDW